MSQPVSREATSQGGAPATLDVTLTASEGQAIVVTAIDSKSSDAYWVRCLPHDFPDLEVRRYPGVPAPTAGYYLAGQRSAVPPGNAAFAMILDGDAVPVWYLDEGLYGVYDVEDLVAGTVSFLPNLSGLPFQFVQFSPYGAYGAGTTAMAKQIALDNHELRRLSNGHYLVFGDPVVPHVDLTGLTLVTPTGNQPLGSNTNVTTCNLLEVDAAGAVVHEWKILDHFAPQVATYPQPGADDKIGPDGKPSIDLFHCNSIDVGPDGNLLVSARNLDSVFYVEWPGGKVLWKLGGKNTSKDGATYVPAPPGKAFYRQHDVRFQGWSTSCGGGAGQISMFDDETGTGAPARAVIYDVTIDGAGAPKCKKPRGATQAWEHVGASQVASMGSFRILPDGSRTIGWGVADSGSCGGQAGLLLTEVDAAGKDLFDFCFATGGASYRAVKVPAGALDIDLLRANAGKKPGPVVP